MEAIESSPTSLLFGLLTLSILLYLSQHASPADVFTNSLPCVEAGGSTFSWARAVLRSVTDAQRMVQVGYEEVRFF